MTKQKEPVLFLFNKTKDSKRVENAERDQEHNP